MFYSILELLCNAFYGMIPAATTFEYLFAVGCAFACCLGVILIPIAIVYIIIKFCLDWRV